MSGLSTPLRPRKDAHPGRHRDVLPAPGRVGDREAVAGLAEARLPESLAGVDVERPEVAIDVPDEGEPAGRRQHGRQEDGALLAVPDLLHRADVVCREPPQHAVRARHLVELDAGDPRPPPPLHQLDVTAGQRHAGLVQRIDDHPRLGAVPRRLPVVPAVQARAGIHRVVHAGVADVLPVVDAAGLHVDRLEDVLVQHLGQVDERPVRRSSFQRMASLPAVNSHFWSSTSTRTRSKTTSRSSVSPGTCWKYQATWPVVGLRASVELV